MVVVVEVIQEGLYRVIGWVVSFLGPVWGVQFCPSVLAAAKLCPVCSVSGAGDDDVVPGLAGFPAGSGRIGSLADMEWPCLLWAPPVPDPGVSGKDVSMPVWASDAVSWLCPVLCSLSPRCEWYSASWSVGTLPKMPI